MNTSPIRGKSPDRKPLTHKAEIPAEVRDAARSIAPEQPKTHKIYDDGSIQEDTVLNHLAYSVGQGNKPEIVEEPKHHKQEINKDNPLWRFPQINLELNRTFLGLPIIEVRILIAKALNEENSPLIHGYYKFLDKFLASWFALRDFRFSIPNVLSQEEYTAIVLTQLALLCEHKEDIFKMCRDPEFSPNEVADFISRKAGLLLDVHSDPNETIRLIENGLIVAQKLLNDIKEDSNPAKDKKNIQEAFIKMNAFPLQNVKFDDHFRQMRKTVIDEYEKKHPVELEHSQGEHGVVQKWKPKFEPNLGIEERLARELVAYTKQTPSNSVSANEFRKYLLTQNVSEKGAEDYDPFIQYAIDEGLLDRYIPDCNDAIDEPQKIEEAECVTYLLNVYRQDKPETQTTKAFRTYLFNEHPILQESKLKDNVDQILQQAIRDKILPPYEPQYSEGTDFKKILEEEALAYKLNQSKNLEAFQVERDALEKYLKRRYLIRSKKH